MGILYVVGAPVGDPGDLSRRALRILGQVALVVADDVGHAQRLLSHYDVAAPVAAAWEDAPLGALQTGDVALLCAGWAPGPSGPDLHFVRTAIEHGISVVPIPGPVLPFTSLVISGLPANGFVYLGQLPEDRAACRDLLSSVAGERRTLLVMALPDRLPTVLTDLHTVLGERPLAVAMASEMGTEVSWRGTLGQSPEQPGGQPTSGPYALVIGGASEGMARWDEERLWLEIETLLAKGLGSKEIGHRLTAESGWSRREIYRLAVAVAQSARGKGNDSNARPDRS